MATPRAVRAFESWVTRTRKGWRGVVVLSICTPLLFLLAMGSGLGSLVDAERSLDGVAYGDFVAPGMLAVAAMQAAVGEATYPVMGALRWDRSYHAMLATPLEVGDIFFGHLMLIAARLLVGAVGFGAVAALLGHVPSPLGVLALPVAVLTGMAFAAPVAAWAITRRSDNEFSILFRLVVIPLFMFSGTFFPLSQLPRGLEVAAWLTPLWHGVDLCRDLALGDVDGRLAVVHLAYLSALLGVGLVAGRRSFARALRT